MTEDVMRPDPSAGQPAGPPPAGAGHASAVAADLAAASRRARWVGPLFAVLAVLMVPWTAYLAVTLPSQATAAHYDLAWAGFDVGLFLVLAWTAWTAVSRSRWLPVTASLNAAFLVIDAWFDVITAPGRRELAMSLTSALLIELPLAAVSIWLAVNGQRIFEHQITLRVLRRPHLRSARRR